MNFEFSDNKDLPLNKMIQEAWDTAMDTVKLSSNREMSKEFIEKLREIYKIGCTDGEHSVWAVRQQNIDKDEGQINNSITVTNSQSETVHIYISSNSDKGKGIKERLFIFRESDNNIDHHLSDAVCRYERLYGFDVSVPMPAIKILDTLRDLASSIEVIRITFYEDSMKIRIRYNEKEFIIDYCFKRSDHISIIYFIKKTLIGKTWSNKTCRIKNLRKTLDKLLLRDKIYYEHMNTAAYWHKN
jgi:hypothetical protein